MIGDEFSLLEDICHSLLFQKINDFAIKSIIFPNIFQFSDKFINNKNNLFFNINIKFFQLF